MKVKVTGPYQVNHDGKNYVAGDTFEAHDTDAQAWVDAGYVEEVKASSSSKTSSKKSSK